MYSGIFWVPPSALGMKPPLSACFAVAGPITEQGIRLTNLPWLMNATALEREFSIPVVKLINDFEAVALSVEVLAADDLVVLQNGAPRATGMRVTLGRRNRHGGRVADMARRALHPLAHRSRTYGFCARR